MLTMPSCYSQIRAHIFIIISTDAPETTISLGFLHQRFDRFFQESTCDLVWESLIRTQEFWCIHQLSSLSDRISRSGSLHICYSEFLFACLWIVKTYISIGIRYTPPALNSLCLKNFPSFDRDPNTLSGLCKQKNRWLFRIKWGNLQYLSLIHI